MEGRSSEGRGKGGAGGGMKGARCTALMAHNLCFATLVPRDRCKGEAFGKEAKQGAAFAKHASFVHSFHPWASPSTPFPPHTVVRLRGTGATC